MIDNGSVFLGFAVGVVVGMMILLAVQPRSENKK